MSDIAIRVSALGKQYRIGQSQRYKALRDTISDTLAAPFRWLKNGSKPNGGGPETFWALKDVNFEVKRGEVIGVIGRNGAGKSTLLKVLSRITEPTEGHAEIHGRVGSLLEVGTGFHPELTGRENIFLNGAILGMKRAEISRKFDEIVAFSEIEKFIDTPAKHYSSGMYMRLAFAVAAHLEPETLVVDEVLAVGDVAFQQKCLGKMSQVANTGRTVLFVSHNMGAITQLCRRAILLQGGKVVSDGKVSTVVEEYWGAIRTSGAVSTVRRDQHLYGQGVLELVEVRLLNPSHDSFNVRWKEPVRLEFVLNAHSDIGGLVAGIAIFSQHGQLVLDTHSRDDGRMPFSVRPGINRIQVTIQNPLRAGTYLISLGGETSLGKRGVFYVREAAHLTVLDVGTDEQTYPHHLGGIVNSSAEWRFPDGV